MSIKVAIATSDKINIDLHFGQASQFQIYELQGDHFEFLETRAVPVPAPKNDELAGGAKNSFSENLAGSGNANEAGGNNLAGGFENSFGAGCGSGFGCGSGCGGGGGGCGGGAGGPISPAVELLLDCRAIVAEQIGQNVRRQFERNAVSVFDIDLTIEEALQKLAAYYLKFEE